MFSIKFVMVWMSDKYRTRIRVWHDDLYQSLPFHSSVLDSSCGLVQYWWVKWSRLIQIILSNTHLVLYMYNCLVDWKLNYKGHTESQNTQVSVLGTKKLYVWNLKCFRSLLNQKQFYMYCWIFSIKRTSTMQSLSHRHKRIHRALFPIFSV